MQCLSVVNLFCSYEHCFVVGYQRAAVCLLGSDSRRDVIPTYPEKGPGGRGGKCVDTQK